MKNSKNLKIEFNILVVVAVIAFSSCIFITTNLIYIQTNKKHINNLLNSHVNREASIINYKISAVSSIAINISDFIESMSSLNENTIYNKIREKMDNEDLLFGCGIWFEPYTYEKNEKYYGPYIYRNDYNYFELTFKYSTSEYNYFNQEWYRNALNESKKEIYYSKVFNDDILNTYFITGSSPIIKNNTPIGVATADISLRGLTDYVNNIQINQKGHAYLLSNNGFLMDDAYHGKLVKINSDMNKKYSNLLNINFSKEEGLLKLNKTNQIAAYKNIGNTGLKLVYIYPKGEIYAPLYKTSIYFFLLTIFSTLVIFIFTNLLFKNKMEKPINYLIQKVNKINSNDFSNDKILDSLLKKKNEFGVLANSITNMCKNMDQNIKNIKRNEENYKLIFEASNECLWDFDVSKNTMFFSGRWNAIFDESFFKDNIKMLDNWLEAIHPEDYKEVRRQFDEILSGTIDILNCEYRIKIMDGTYIWLSSRAKSLKDAECKPYRLAGSHSNITQRKIEEEKIRNLAYFDSLTNLPNKTYFNIILKDLIEKKKLGNGKFSVLFLDLDGFKLINDSFGHSIGDKVLFNFSLRLKNLYSKNLIISRFSGDEFILIVDNVAEKDEILKIENQIHNVLKEPFYIEDHIFYITSSIGISFYPENGVTADELLKNADTAMFIAKEEGKDRSVFFNKKMNELITKKTELEADMRRGIKNEEFTLFFQPFYDIKTNKIVGFEALIRWYTPNKGMLSPAIFISLAEDTKLIVPLGNWIIKSACSFIKKLLSLGYKDIIVAINVSVIQLMAEDFSEVIINAVEEAEIPYECLEIEITESKLMESYDACIKNIEKLIHKGIQFSIDDFGTGYSSLNYLKQLPISTIKIDKSFVDDLLEASSKNFIELIIVLSHTLNLKVIAEGVEERRQLDILKSYNCDIIQGYYISKPLPENEAIKFIASFQ